jgi:hypothetical protein
MEKIFRIPLTKAQLAAIPAEDRNLLLLAGHAVNQMAILRKVLIFSTNYGGPSELENTLSAGQSQIILRLLFATLAETWELVKRPVNQKLIGKDYFDDFGADGQAAYDVLKKHFGSSSLLHNLRNTLVFHYPDASTMQAAFDLVPEDDDCWAWYPATTINNSFYLASDLVISGGVIRATGESDFATAFGRVMDVVLQVSNEMTDFLLFLMRAIGERHLGSEAFSFTDESAINIVEAPQLRHVSIPFFTFKDDHT